MEGEPAKIRYMGLADAKVITEIEASIFPNPWSEQGIVDLLVKNPLSRGIILEVGNKIAGYGFYWIVADELHIANIAVVKEYRRRKFGAKLVEFMIDRGREKGAVYALLEVRLSNTAAVELYKGFGFKKLDVRKKYYSDNQEDALIMALLLKE